MRPEPFSQASPWPPRPRGRLGRAPPPPMSPPTATKSDVPASMSDRLKLAARYIGDPRRRAARRLGAGHGAARW